MGKLLLFVYFAIAIFSIQVVNSDSQSLNSNPVTICIYFFFLFSEKTSNGDYHINKGRYLKNVTHSPMNTLQASMISAADIKLVSNDIFCTHAVLFINFLPTLLAAKTVPSPQKSK